MRFHWLYCLKEKKNTCNFSSPQITIILHKTTTTYILLNYKKKKILFWKIWEKREIEMKNKKYVIFSHTVRSIIIWKKKCKTVSLTTLKKVQLKFILGKRKKIFLGEKKENLLLHTNEKKIHSVKDDVSYNSIYEVLTEIYLYTGNCTCFCLYCLPIHTLYIVLGNWYSGWKNR